MPPFLRHGLRSVRRVHGDGKRARRDQQAVINGLRVRLGRLGLRERGTVSEQPLAPSAITPAQTSAAAFATTVLVVPTMVPSVLYPPPERPRSALAKRAAYCPKPLS